MKYSVQNMEAIGYDNVQSVQVENTKKWCINIENTRTLWTLKSPKQYCEQTKPRQKTKRHQNCNQKGAATNSTAISEHKDWQKKA